jgi:hypothetical protein
MVGIKAKARATLSDKQRGVKRVFSIRSLPDRLPVIGCYYSLLKSHRIVINRYLWTAEETGFS